MARTVSREARLLPFVGPLWVGYLVVQLVVTSRGLDGASIALLVVAALGAASPHWFSRASERGPLERPLDPAKPPRAGVGRRRLSWLGVSVATLAVTHASREPSGLEGSLLLELAGGVSLPVLGALVVDLAWTTPDELPRPRGVSFDPRKVLRAFVIVSAATACVLELLRFAAALEVPGLGLVLVPHTIGAVSLGLVTLYGLVALALRAARRRGRSAPEAVAASSFALFGLTLALGFAAVAVAARVLGAAPRSLEVRGLEAAALASVLVGHLVMVDDARPVRAAAALRELVATLSSLGIAAAFALLARPSASALASPFAWAVGAVLLVLVAGAGHAFFRRLSDRLLAPDGGRLLEGIEAARARIAAAHGLELIAEAALGPLRRGARGEASASRIVVFDPAREARIDAAGVGHAEARASSKALVDRILERPLEVIVARPIVESAVRRPELRPLVGALVEHDALVVVPLGSAADVDAVEGALLVARDGRRAAVTLEEIAALERLGRELGARVASWAEGERARHRAGEALVAAQRLEERVFALEDELGERARASDEAASSAPFAYAPSSRAALRALEEASARDTPLLVRVERGTAVTPWIAWTHRRGPRAIHPLVLLECAELPAEEAEGRVLAALREAGRGTLALIDLIALPPPAQEALAEAIASRSIRLGREAHPLHARVIATARLGAGSEPLPLTPELARRLSAQPIAIPPLSERLADARSLALRAIERACRREARALVGIEDEAMRWLEAHALEDGERGLERAIDRAIVVAVPPRIRVVDLERALSLAGSEVGEDPLDATLAEVEERAILRALSRTNGNKSEAARLLGLKRTTFLDRLRRLGIDDGSARPEA